jgi:O-antigen/teichoic acid export membrane protein
VAAVLLANADRIALSKMVTTAELGKYAVAFTAAGLLQLAIQPFYRSFFPRYSELVALGETNRKQLHNEYFQSCRLMAGAIIPLGIICWFYAPQIFNVWIGNSDVTIVNVFRWLLVGITCSGLVWLPAAFQHAHGWTSLHAAMITGALVIGAPAMVWAIDSYGIVGATAVWVLHGVSDITLGLWLMHRRLLVGELLRWYRVVILLPLLVTIPGVAISIWLMPNGMNKWFNLCWIGATILILISIILYCHATNLRQSNKTL